MKTQVKQAIRQFWDIRDGGNGVLGGKTLDGFVDIIENTVKAAGLESAIINTSRVAAQLPGYFRPHKAWDVVITYQGILVAAIELKSQVGSIGNNFNNRTEEVLGSGIDLHTAIEEEAFGSDAEIFTGYIILVESTAQSHSNPMINMKHFAVMKGFLADESSRDECYTPNKKEVYPSVKGVSYVERYDLLCKRLMLKKLYTSAALILARPEDHTSGDYASLSPQTSIETFLTKLHNHCSIIANYDLSN